MTYQAGGLSAALFGAPPAEVTLAASVKPTEIKLRLADLALTSLEDDVTKKKHKKPSHSSSRPSGDENALQRSAKHAKTKRSRKDNLSDSGNSERDSDESEAFSDSEVDASDVSSSEDEDTRAAADSDESSTDSDDAASDSLPSNEKPVKDQSVTQPAAQKQLEDADGTDKEATQDADAYAEKYKDELSRTVLVKGVPLDVTAHIIRRWLELRQVDVEKVRFRCQPVHPKFYKNPKVGLIRKEFAKPSIGKHAYVVLASAELVNKSLLRSGSKLQGKMVFVDRVLPPGSKKFSLFDRLRTIFVGRLPLGYDEERLHELFAEFGKIENVRVVRDSRTHQSKGMGFVCFDNKAAVPLAIKAYKKREVDGHPLNVMRPMKESEALEAKQQAQFKEREKRAKAKVDRLLRASMRNAKTTRQMEAVMRWQNTPASTDIDRMPRMVNGRVLDKEKLKQKILKIGASITKKPRMRERSRTYNAKVASGEIVRVNRQESELSEGGARAERRTGYDSSRKWGCGPAKRPSGQNKQQRHGVSQPRGGFESSKGFGRGTPRSTTMVRPTAGTMESGVLRKRKSQGSRQREMNARIKAFTGVARPDKPRKPKHLLRKAAQGN